MNVDHLQLEYPKWRIEPSDALVREFEDTCSLVLPADYRAFLSVHGGSIVHASCPYLELTPFGDRAFVDQFFGFTPPERYSGDVRRTTDLIQGAPDVVAIGDDFLGGMLWLKCTGTDAGHVYYNDPQQRWSWPDEMFYKQYPNLAPEVEHYLALRRAGELPPKRRGYDNVYLVARSFTELIGALVPTPEEDT